MLLPRRAAIVIIPASTRDGGGGAEQFDVVVVVAGPGGSTAAYRMARGGARVLMLDRARFPRDKPCGGGLTGRALKSLAIDVTAVVEDTIDRVALRLGLRSVSV